MVNPPLFSQYSRMYKPHSSINFETGVQALLHLQNTGPLINKSYSEKKHKNLIRGKLSHDEN